MAGRGVGAQAADAGLYHLEVAGLRFDSNESGAGGWGQAFVVRTAAMGIDFHALAVIALLGAGAAGAGSGCTS